VIIPVLDTYRVVNVLVTALIGRNMEKLGKHRYIVPSYFFALRFRYENTSQYLPAQFRTEPGRI
jgi:hypothetical protein